MFYFMRMHVRFVMVHVLLIVLLAFELITSLCNIHKKIILILKAIL